MEERVPKEYRRRWRSSKVSLMGTGLLAVQKAHYAPFFSPVTQRKAGIIPVTPSSNQCIWGRRREQRLEGPIWLRPITTTDTPDTENQQAMLGTNCSLPSYRADVAWGFLLSTVCNFLPGSVFGRQRNRDQTPNFIKTNKSLILPAACLYSCSSCL